MYIEWPLIWDQRTIDKVIRKHRVTPEEVDEAIFDGHPVIVKGPGRTYHAFGRTISGRFLLIVLAKAGSPGRYRVITTRPQEEKEKRYFRKHQGQ